MTICMSYKNTYCEVCIGIIVSIALQNMLPFYFEVKKMDLKLP